MSSYKQQKKVSRLDRRNTCFQNNFLGTSWFMTLEVFTHWRRYISPKIVFYLDGSGLKVLYTALDEMRYYRGITVNYHSERTGCLTYVFQEKLCSLFFKRRYCIQYSRLSHYLYNILSWLLKLQQVGLTVSPESQIHYYVMCKSCLMCTMAFRPFFNAS